MTASQAKAAADWAAYKESVRPKTFSDLPLFVRRAALRAARFLRNRQGCGRVFIVGSWANGGAVSASTPSEIKLLRRAMTGKAKMSDLDIMAEGVKKSPPISLLLANFQKNLPVDFVEGCRGGQKIEVP